MKQRVRTFGLISACNLIRELGHDPEEVLRQAGLDPDEIYRPGAQVSSSAILDVMDVAATVTNRQDFGMLWGSRNDYRRLGPISTLAANCDSIRQSVEDTSVYVHRQNWGVRCAIVDMGEFSRIDFDLHIKSRQPASQYVESLIIAHLPLWRHMLGSNWTPVEVWFHHQALAPASVYAGMFGCDVRFGMRANAIVCRTVDLDRRETPTDRQIKSVIQAMLEEELKCARLCFLDAVRQSVRRILPQGDVTLYGLARQMDMDGAEIEEQLAEAGQGFRQIVNDVRLELFAELAEDPEMGASRLFPHLGFRDMAAMNRFIRQNARRIRADLARKFGRDAASG
jgi:AraC-like DNA-binding protein